MVLAFCAALSMDAHATLDTYYLSNPIGWMHSLPGGEQPGWQSPFWINSEISHSNIWNPEIEVVNKATGKKLRYEADFEQTHAVLNLGFALWDRIGFSVEAPYTIRGGGGMDHFINQFHIMIGSDRFARSVYLNNRYSMSLKTEGEQQVSHPAAQGVGNLVFKTKFWLFQWKSPTPGLCDCGLSISLRAKTPLAEANSGLTSGGVDGSALVHLGVPISKQSGMWWTSGLTYTKDNKLLKDWPRRQWQSMHELTFDIGFYGNYGFFLSARVESPFMNKSSLSISNPDSLSEEKLVERIGSTWNSLVEWRGSEGFGFRWHSQKGDQIRLFMIEDWTFGHVDDQNQNVSVYNSPDVAFVLQTKFGF